MSARRMTVVLGTAAGAFLAAGLIPLATSPVAHAVCAPDDSMGCDPDFISANDRLFKLFGVTDIGAADPDNSFEGMILNIPSLGITDVLTSGNAPRMPGWVGGNAARRHRHRDGRRDSEHVPQIRWTQP